MFVILVYDTLAVRNPKILKTCRQYLHWTQRSVFQGELSAAQYRSLMHAIEDLIDHDYDSVVAYRAQNETMIETDILGQQLASDSPVL